MPLVNDIIFYADEVGNDTDDVEQSDLEKRELRDILALTAEIDMESDGQVTTMFIQALCLSASGQHARLIVHVWID